MPIKSKRIHLIEKDCRIEKISDQVWESGFWSIPEAKAKQLLGGSILFHKKKSEPSFFGGLILNYRIQDMGQFRGRVIFTFEYQADHRGFVAEREGWGQEKKVVMKE
jgi:hypothetical protein